MTAKTVGNGIVVGVDGSEASLSALRWAGDQACVLGIEVVAVHAWEPVAARAPYAPTTGRPTLAEQRERAAELLASSVRRAFGPQVGPRIRAVLVQGPPVRVLLGQAHEAALLALGRRAHGHWELPELGAVGRECLRYAQVPVVTVPPAEKVLRPLRTAGTPAARSGVA